MPPRSFVGLVVCCALPGLLAAGPPLHPRPDRRGDPSAHAARLAELLRRGELTLARVQPDTAFPGRRHLRYDQRVSGVRVFGAQLVEQLDPEGETLSVFGHVEDAAAAPDVRPTLTSDQAVRAALAELPAGARGLGEPELVLLPRDGGLRLVWTLRVRFDQLLERVFVDAASGAIADRYSDLQTQAAVGRGRGVWGDEKKISVESEQGVYRARDRLRPPALLTYDLRGDYALGLQALDTGYLDPSYVALDSDNEWTDGAVVDAHVYAGLTYDYYFQRHGRRGLNDHDNFIASVTHLFPRSFQYANAFWDPSVNAMFYGDGDGQFGSFSGALDVVAHELTHGVTSFTWAGIYQNESGALNEAFSDIMATGAEFLWQSPGNGRLMADYYLGEDLAYAFDPPRTATRSLENPGLFCASSTGCDPDHYSRLYRGPLDNGGVHHNSGIANQAFYLLAEGGVNRTSGLRVSGLGTGGREKAERIFYRGFTVYLTPRATFHDARVATVQAARDLYGAAEASLVAATWSAVGVE
jgi:Zn-dependent metalloprotease